MNKRRKKICFLLCWIFMIPIIFQPLHVVVHHADDPVQISSTSEDNTFKKVINPQNDESLSDNTCFVCDYLFSVKGVSKNVSLSSFPSIISNTPEESLLLFFSRIVFSLKSPRAPPIHL